MTTMKLREHKIHIPKTVHIRDYYRWLFAIFLVRDESNVGKNPEFEVKKISGGNFHIVKEFSADKVFNI